MTVQHFTVSDLINACGDDWRVLVLALLLVGVLGLVVAWIVDSTYQLIRWSGPVDRWVNRRYRRRLEARAGVVRG